MRNELSGVRARRAMLVFLLWVLSGSVTLCCAIGMLLGRIPATIYVIQTIYLNVLRNGSNLSSFALPGPLIVS